MSNPNETLDQMVDALLRAKKQRAGADFSASTMARLKSQEDGSKQLDQEIEGLLSKQPVSAPDGFTQATLQRLHTEDDRRRIVRFPWLATASAAAAALALAAVLQPWREDPATIHTASLPTQTHEQPVDAGAGSSLTGIEAEHSDLERLFLLAEGIDGADPLLKEENLRTLALLKPST